MNKIRGGRPKNNGGGEAHLGLHRKKFLFFFHKNKTSPDELEQKSVMKTSRKTWQRHKKRGRERTPEAGLPRFFLVNIGSGGYVTGGPLESEQVTKWALGPNWGPFWARCTK